MTGKLYQVKHKWRYLWHLYKYRFGEEKKRDKRKKPQTTQHHKNTQPQTPPILVVLTVSNISYAVQKNIKYYSFNLQLKEHNYLGVTELRYTSAAGRKWGTVMEGRDKWSFPQVETPAAYEVIKLVRITPVRKWKPKVTYFRINSAHAGFFSTREILGFVSFVPYWKPHAGLKHNVQHFQTAPFCFLQEDKCKGLDLDFALPLSAAVTAISWAWVSILLTC